MLTVNEEPYPFQPGLFMADLVREIKPGADVLLLNGNRVNDKVSLHDGDTCILIKKGEQPTDKEMNKTLANRQGREYQKILAGSVIGIMGLGGLGSAVAVSLVKIGVGKLVISDYDVVELSNIHRQHYFIDQIGLNKTVALKNNLARINPFVEVQELDTMLTEENIPSYFHDMNVLIECFDNPAMKAAALRAALTHLPGISYVGASGMAGLESGNAILSRRLRPGVYIVGDDTSDTATCGTLFAPRVGIAAHHQAHQAVRLLLNLDDEHHTNSLQRQRTSRP
jgi:sulfur carrier protein ThiS adenylyltransferase